MIYLVDIKEQGALFAPLMPASVAERLGEKGIFLVGAVEDKKAVGAAVMELLEKQAELCSIVVSPKYRRRGIGRALMERCVTLLQSTTVQSFYASLGGNQGELAAFFTALPWFRPRQTAVCFQAELGKLGEVKLLSGPAPRVQTLESVDGPVYQAYLRETFMDDPKQCRRRQMEQRISQVVLENGRVAACLLFSRQEQGLAIQWMQNKSSDKLAPLYLLRAGLAAACRYYSPETKIVFCADSPQAVRLALRVLEGVADQFPVYTWEISDSELMLFEEQFLPTD